MILYKAIVMIGGYLVSVGQKQMFLIDIAVPRDISPEVGSIYNVVLYNIDDLQAVVGVNIQKRCEEAEKAKVEVEYWREKCKHREDLLSPIYDIFNQHVKPVIDIGHNLRLPSSWWWWYWY